MLYVFILVLKNYDAPIAVFKSLEPKTSRMHFWISTGKFKDGTLWKYENINKLERTKKLSLLGQFFSVLVRFKTALFLLDLSEKFDPSISFISKIFTSWIVFFLYHDLPLHFPFEKLKKRLWLNWKTRTGREMNWWLIK